MAKKKEDIKHYCRECAYARDFHEKNWWLNM